MRLEWDEAKAAKNLRQHGVSFTEGGTVFGDPLATTKADPDHSEDEERSLTTGLSSDNRPVIVWHADREDAGELVIRIIGVRRPTPREWRTYESGE